MTSDNIETKTIEETCQQSDIRASQGTDGVVSSLVS